jgi:hypothetical protein
MISRGRGGKKKISFYEDDIKTYKIMSAILNSNGMLPDLSDLEDRTSKKPSKKSGEIGFLKPVIADDNVVALMTLVETMSPDLQLKNTYPTADGKIATCFMDIKTCVAKYIKDTASTNGDYLILDANMVAILGDDFVLEGLRDGKLANVGGALYVHKTNGGTPGKVASALYRNLNAKQHVAF